MTTLSPRQAALLAAIATAGTPVADHRELGPAGTFMQSTFTALKQRGLIRDYASAPFRPPHRYQYALTDSGIAAFWEGLEA